jgi:hypothetical protein
MPAHLVNVAVLDPLAKLGSASDSRIVLYAREEVRDRAQAVVDQAARLLATLETALEVKFPESKLDLVLVPKLQMGPTSGPGLVVLRYPIRGR